MKKRVLSLLLALVLLCAPLSGCAAREAERYDVLASTAPVRAMTAALLAAMCLCVCLGSVNIPLREGRLR